MGSIEALFNYPRQSPYTGATGQLQPVFLPPPKIVQITAEEAARVDALRRQQYEEAARAGQGSAGAPPQPAASAPPVAMAGVGPVANPQQAPASWPALGTGTGGTVPPAPDGLLPRLQGKVAAAAQPASGGLLQRLGVKLFDLSPAASQALIAGGLSMLAGNDGSRNLGQLIGIGGMAGLNAYRSAQQQAAAAAANELTRQKLDMQAKQQGAASNLAQEKQNRDLLKPFVVGADQNIYVPGKLDENGMPTPGSFLQGPGSTNVATWQELQGQDGMKYRQGFTRAGEPVRDARVLVDNPYAGPLSDFQQKTVNDAQTSAQSSISSLHRVADLADRLQNAPDYASGLRASFNDWTTKITGNKDASQQIRGELTQYVNSYILDNRPLGSLSDADQRYLRQGVPSDNASKETWIGFLNSVGKLRQAVAARDQASADFVTANRGSLGPLMQSATIGGRTFPAGTSLADVTDAIWNGAGQPVQSSRAGNARSTVVDAARAELARRRGVR